MHLDPLPSGLRPSPGMTAAETTMRRLAITALLLALPACKILPTEVPQAKGDAGSAAPAGFDPNGMVAGLWDGKVMPYLDAKAGPFTEVMALAERSPDEAGQKYGFRAKEGSSPWTVVVKLTGKIIAANTESRAATIDVDADGDGKADARVQIGPALRGTALRDSIDFVNFNTFTNQIDFAQFGKAFNTYVDKATLSKLPRDKLVGGAVTVLGAVPLDRSSPPLVTPATVTLGAGS
jgi:predicted lipoprotein